MQKDIVNKLEISVIKDGFVIKNYIQSKIILNLKLFSINNLL